MGALRPIHWFVLILVLLLLFGAKRLPDLARSLGQSMKIFKKEIKDLQEDGQSRPTPPAVSATPEVNAAPSVSPDAGISSNSAVSPAPGEANIAGMHPTTSADKQNHEGNA